MAYIIFVESLIVVSCSLFLLISCREFNLCDCKCIWISKRLGIEKRKEKKREDTRRKESKKNGLGYLWNETP